MRKIFLPAAICCFLWGTATPTIKIGYSLFSVPVSDTASIILFAGVRFFIAGILVIAFESIGKRKLIVPSRQSIVPIFVIAAFQTVIQYSLFYLGLSVTSGMVGTIISGSNGLISLLLVVFVLRKEEMTFRKLSGCVLGMAGLIVMNLTSLGAESSGRGEIMILLSTVSLSVSGILMKNYSSDHDVVMISGYQFLVGGLVMILISLPFGGRIAVASLKSVPVLMYLSFISASAYSLWAHLLERYPVSSVTVFSFLTPVFGVIASAVILSEIITPSKIISLLLISAGIVIVNIGELRKKRAIE